MDFKVVTVPELVRGRLGMFVGDINRATLFEELVLESLCHAFDEVIDGRCSHASLRVGSPGEVTVEYDAGINLKPDYVSLKPFADKLFCELYACSNQKKHFEVGSKFCQMGLAVLTAVCSRLDVVTIFDGKRGCQTYLKGIAPEEFKVAVSTELNRTVIRFVFDEALLGKCVIHIDALRQAADELVADLPKNFELRIV